MYHAVRILNTLLPLCYAAAVAAYAIDFVRGDPLAARVARRAMDVALTTHVVFLLALTLYERHLPLSSAAELLTFVALGVAIVYVVVERRTGVARTGLFVVALSLVSQIVSTSFLELRTPFPAILESPLFAVHTVAGVIGYAAFGVSAIYSALYLLLHRVLKRARFGLLFDRLPPLDVLARMSVRAAKVGVASLTVTIAVGTAWAVRTVPSVIGDPKFLLTVLVWAGYLTAVLLHGRAGWSDRRTLGGFLVGFALLVAAAVATRLLFDTFHAFA
jgi:HemX protein